MKKFLIFFSGIFLCISLSAQEYKNCTDTYFKNSKKKSTSQCLTENKNEDIAYAYNLKGEVIGEWKLSRMHMISGVRFSFHENGAVSKADFSSHPDAGIQWYKSYTTYDENGVQTGFTELSDDLYGTIQVEPAYVKTKEEYIKEQKSKDSLKLLPVVEKEIKKDSAHLKQEVIECAVIYVSELWIENKTGKDIMLKWDKKYKGDASASSGTKENSLASQKVKKGEKIKITEQIQAQFYESPIATVNISIWNSKGKKKLNSKLSEKPLIDESRLNENRKGFVYEVK